MVLYDSSALIDYLDGDDAVVDYVSAHVDERTVTIPLVAFEVYQGEVYRSDGTDFDAVAEALSWLDVVAVDGVGARRAAELLASLHDAGVPLAARDAFIAGIAHARDERLVATDSDFENDALAEYVPVDVPEETD